MNKLLIAAAAIGAGFLIFGVVRRQQQIKAGQISPGITTPIGPASPPLMQQAVIATHLISIKDIPAVDLIWAGKRAKTAVAEALKRGEITPADTQVLTERLKMEFLKQRYPNLV